ncbi:hypothetical protein CHS0354_033352 [Potamilus streckersoni]|uniref:Uncharacterized protein n=1 Tax=Potamilus streckersoni TaxID=2493646 RepID=A0AAE0RTG6_9BIVA|nr:hypothetical protein CHS0354_033352 [Potamilus streckersoni]
MATMKASPRLHDRLKCPLCLMVFKMPRILPCFHSFCQGCLQSHISKNIKNNENAKSFQCPICKKATRNSSGRKTSDLALAFPLNTVASFLLSVKNEKADFTCDPCRLGDKAITGEGYCLTCDETLCKQCIMYHRANKTMHTHEILNIDELTSKPEYIIKLSKTADCPKHTDQEVAYYCKDHKILFCDKCQNDHKGCFNKRDLLQHAREEIEQGKIEEVMEQFWNLLEHLETFIRTNKENVKSLENQVEKVIKELQRIRNKFNETFDELETKVKQECERIYNNEASRVFQENERCKPIIASIRTSYKLMETMTTYGLKSDFNIYLTLNKMENHLEYYNKSVKKYFSKKNFVTVELNEELKKLENLQKHGGSLISVYEHQIDSPYKQLTVSSDDYKITRIKVVDIRDTDARNTHYTGAAFSSTGDSYVLVDRENNKCLLFTSSNNCISQMELPAKPWDVCLCGENDVAVSFPEAKLVQIAKLKDGLFDSARMISVDIDVSGLAALDKDNLVFSGKLSGKYCWGVIQTSDGGKKLSHFEINDSEDLNDEFFHTYLAVNTTMDRVYISCSGINTVYCYGLDGRVNFKYQNKDLNIPLCIDLDSENNVYVVGYRSPNIHQLSPDGRLIQIVQSGVPLDPVALTFHPNGENFIVTGQRQARKLYVFRINYKGYQK